MTASAANPLESADSNPDSAAPWPTPVAQSLDRTTTQQLIAELPEDTFELLVREAYLFRAGEIILRAMDEAKARFDTVSESRPPFFVFRRSTTKESFTANLSAATQDLSLYNRAVKRNAAAMKRLRKCAELHIEDWLREHDPVYRHGLVSEALVADWHRCITRLDTGLAEFIAAVGSARNSLVSSVANAQGVRFVSDISRHAILEAAATGQALASEVAATNVLAAERDAHLRGTAFESTFPRLPTFDFAASLREAVGLPVPLLQQRFGKILERCEELRAIGFPALMQQVQQAEAQHTAVKASYLVGVWQSIRDFVLEHYVEDHDLDDVARGTEQMFERGVFA